MDGNGKKKGVKHQMQKHHHHHHHTFFSVGTCNIVATTTNISGESKYSGVLWC